MVLSVYLISATSVWVFPNCSFPSCDEQTSSYRLETDQPSPTVLKQNSEPFPLSKGDWLQKELSKIGAALLMLLKQFKNRFSICKIL